MQFPLWDWHSHSMLWTENNREQKGMLNMKKLLALVLGLAMILCVNGLAFAADYNEDGGTATLTAAATKTETTSITVTWNQDLAVAYTWASGKWSAAITNADVNFTATNNSSGARKVTATWAANADLGKYGLSATAPATGMFAGEDIARGATSTADATKLTFSTSGDPDAATIDAMATGATPTVGTVTFAIGAATPAP